MLLKLPFFENKGDGSQCFQVAMQAVLKHFLNKDFSLEELDELTGRKPGFWTWTSQIVPVLYDLGLEVKYFSKESSEPYLQGEPFIREHFGKDAEKILKFTDLPIVIASIKKLKKYSLFEQRLLSFDEIEDHLKKGNVPLMTIDYNVLVGKQGLYQGHFVAVTGFDKESVFYHESGPKNPKANKKVKKELFIQAWNANGTDNDAVIVFGKRKD